MSNSHPRGRLMVSATVTSLSIILALAFVLPADGAGRASTAEVAGRSAARATPLATLAAVGTRYVGAPIEIRGRTCRGSRDGTSCSSSGTPRLPAGGTPSPSVSSARAGTASRRSAGAGPGNVAFRTVLFARGRPVSVSRVIHVHVRSPRPVVARPVSSPTCTGSPSQTTCPPRPDAVEQERTVEAPYCPHLTVTTRHQTRTVDWRWDSAARRSAEAPTPWVTDSTTERAAGAADCVHILNQVPATAALPDLQIRDMTTCPGIDFDATNGTCFKIVPSAPYNPDYPSLEGKKLLKFGVVTMNTGAGPSEIIADRTARDCRGLEGVPDLLRPGRASGSARC